MRDNVKRGIGFGLALLLACSSTPAQATNSGVTRNGCIKIDREWLIVKRDLAGVEAVYKVADVAAALQHASGVWSSSATTVRARGGIKVAAALTKAAVAARALRVKLLSGKSKGAVALSSTMASALEKTVLPACAPLF
jgi:hypothetical protein